MKQHIIRIGLDFDEIQYQGKTRTEGTGEVNEFEKKNQEKKPEKSDGPCQPALMMLGPVTFNDFTGIFC